MSHSTFWKIANAIKKHKPSTAQRRVAYQEAIARANRRGEIVNNEAASLLWLLDQSYTHRPAKRRVRAGKRKHSYGRR